MSADRYVVLGLARPRAEWFRTVSQWSTSAALPVEFVKCMSGEELRTRLGSGRPFSAVLVDGTVPAADRDLLEAAREAGCAVLVVDDGAGSRDWGLLGAAAVLGTGMRREELLDSLATHAQPLGRGAAHLLEVAPGGEVPLHRALTVAACGPGGTGASTVAAAAAQGLAAAGRHGPVLLADLCLHAEQAMLHDVRDVVPGVQELVEAHRSRRPDAAEVRRLCFVIPERGYHLLLGLRRARYWASLRPRAFTAAFDSLRAAFGAVVCDVTADFEGEDDNGAGDLEDRNLMARAAVGEADVVLAVGRPGTKGIHSLVRVLGELAAAGVAPERVVPVLNGAPRSPRRRAELAATLAQLAGPAVAGGALATPVFLPVRRVEEAHRDGARLPGALSAPLVGAIEAALRRMPARIPEPAAPEPVRPGSLGTWPAHEEAG